MTEPGAVDIGLNQCDYELFCMPTKYGKEES